MKVFGSDASLDLSQSESLANELSRLGVELDELDIVADPLKSSLAAAAVFRVNAGNLRIATGDGISLEEIAPHGRVVEHVLAHLDDYLESLRLAGAYSAIQPDQFASVLSIAATQDPESVEPIARAAQPDLKVRDIDDVAAEAWVGVAASDRLTLTARNVRKYLDARSLDAAMISTLENQRSVTVDEDDTQPERRELARIIVNCADLSVDARVDLVRDLQLDRPLEVGEVNLEEGDLFGALVSAALIPDTAEAYVALSALSWESKEKFVINSNDFSSYLPQLPLTDGDISAIVTSALVPSAVRDKLVTDFDSLSASVGAQGARDLIHYAESRNLSFTGQGLDVIADVQPGERPLLSAIAAAQTHVDDFELLGLLRRAGGDTALLAERGNRPLTVPDVPLIEQLLQRLDAQELVSTFSRADDNTWRVNMRRP